MLPIVKEHCVWPVYPCMVDWKWNWYYVDTNGKLQPINGEMGFGSISVCNEFRFYFSFLFFFLYSPFGWFY